MKRRYTRRSNRVRHALEGTGRRLSPAQRAPRPSRPLAAIAPLGALSRTSQSSERTGSRLRLRLTVTAVIVLGLFSVLFVRLWSLQVVQGPRLFDSAVQTTTRSVDVAAPRGELIARGGQLLAGDRLENVVTLAQSNPTPGPAVIGRLAALFGVSTASINLELHNASLGLGDLSQYAAVPVSPASGATQAEILDIYENSTEFPGVKVEPTYERTYPEGALAAQMLGYVGDINQSELKAYAKDGYTAQDSIGQEGIEAQYEHYLRGTPGKESLNIDASGAVVSQVSSTAPRQGDTIALNMDFGLEQTLQNALSAQIANLRDGSVSPGAVPADFGAAVVLDDQNGQVLAITSYPSYNDNLWVGGISSAAYEGLVNEEGHPLDDYAIGGLQAPGSTFKLVTATAALNDGLISPGTYFDDTGSYTIPGSTQVLHDSNGEVLGEVNVTSALSESSDIFFYNLGARFWYAYADSHLYGPTPIQNTAAQYGLGKATGIDLPGELSGQVDSAALRKILHASAPSAYPNTYYGVGDNVELAFGQGETLVTPLQMANAYATFANGGTNYQPELAGAIVSPSGHVIRQIPPKVVGHVAYTAGTYQAILSGFEGTVQNPLGTAYAAFQGFNFSKWTVGGKTGTATPTNNVNTQPTSWFVAFGGPKGNSPKYTIAVEIDQGGYGANAAAPVARQVFDYLQNHPVGAVVLPSSPKKSSS